MRKVITTDTLKVPGYLTKRLKVENVWFEDQRRVSDTQSKVSRLRCLLATSDTAHPSLHDFAHVLVKYPDKMEVGEKKAAEAKKSISSPEF